MGVRFTYDDGGRAAAGFPTLLLAGGAPGDCFVRGVAIATGRSYAEVHADVAGILAEDGLSRRRARLGGHLPPDHPALQSARADPDLGVPLHISGPFMQSLGYGWTLNERNLRLGAALVRHRTLHDLPTGRYVVEFRGPSDRHIAALIDGELRDISDHTRKPMWGWWSTSVPVVPLV